MIKFESWARDIQAYALENYESDGWDYIVECWTLDELVDACSAFYTYDEAFSLIASIAVAYDDARQDAQFD